MSAWTWIKSKAGWIAGWFVVLLGAAVAVLITRSLSKSEVKAALALKRLTDSMRSHTAAQTQADALKQKTNALAEALLAEELNLAAEKKKADAMDPDAVLADLKRRGLIK